MITGNLPVGSTVIGNAYAGQYTHTKPNTKWLLVENTPHSSEIWVAKPTQHNQAAINLQIQNKWSFDYTKYQWPTFQVERRAFNLVLQDNADAIHLLKAVEADM